MPKSNLQAGKLILLKFYGLAMVIVAATEYKNNDYRITDMCTGRDICVTMKNRYFRCYTCFCISCYY